MKFSISFKYSNVVFKNKETKETISYDTKAETGNTFTFDNVDEDVVLGIVKGIKDRKAAQVFSYDDFRTNFINVMARNKCKELYDKLDKGGWKVEDIAISNITIKDLEFTKPTMNARENLTVESKKVNEDFKDTMRKQNQEDLIDVVNKSIKDIDLICNKIEDDDIGERLFNVRTNLLNALPSTKTAKKMGWNETMENRQTKRQIAESYWEIWNSHKLTDPYKVIFTDGTEITIPGNDAYCSTPVNFFKKYRLKNKILKERYGEDIFSKEIDHFEVDGKVLDLYDVKREYDDYIEEYRSKMSFEESRKTINESEEPVIFKKDRRDGEVVAFFPETMFDGSVNRGNIMCYAHNGQSSEASIEYFQECRPCKDEAEYADLLAELQDYFSQSGEPTTLKVVRKPSYRRGNNRR